MDTQTQPSHADQVLPISATIAVWHQTSTKRGGFSLAAASYGIALTSLGGETTGLWGAGYAPNPPPLFVLAIHRLLRIVPAQSRLTVHAHEELARYLGFPFGYVRYAIDHNGRGKSGKKLPCFPEMKEITLAMDAERWTLVPYHDGWTAPNYVTANSLARGAARSAAERHKAQFAPTSVDYPSPVILQEGP